LRCKTLLMGKFSRCKHFRFEKCIIFYFQLNIIDKVMMKYVILRPQKSES